MITIIKRQTIQKQYIKEALKDLNHPTAKEIYLYVYKLHPHISKATIYRNLNELAEAKEIYKFICLDGSNRYDINIDRHYHFVCDNCNEVSDLKMDYIENIEGKIKNMDDYKFTSHNIIFTGLCPKCQKNKGE